MSEGAPSYRFIDTPQESNPATRRELQRAVRSHAASVSRSDESSRRQNRIRRLNNPARGVTVFDANPTGSSNTTEREPSQPVGAAQRNDDLTLPSSSRGPNLGQRALDPSSSLWSSLSGQTFSPISHLELYHKPYVPGLINHYITNLTIPIPELDGSATVPLFRAVWLPVVVHDPVIFQIIVLFAATHHATYADPSQFNSLHSELLSLKQSALSALIEKVQSEQGTIRSDTSAHRGAESHALPSDSLIAAVAKMASFEAIFGAAEAVSILNRSCHAPFRC